MDALQMQLEQCIGGICQIRNALAQIGDLGSPQLTPLHIAKYGLVTAAVSLSRLIAAPSGENDSVVTVGSLVLAPRVLRNTIVDDIALVICENVAPGDADECCQLSRSFSILWVRPQSLYEFQSCGINFDGSYLHFRGKEIFQRQELSLSNIRVYNSILCKAFAGVDIWVIGEVIKIHEDSQMIDVTVLSTDRGCSLFADLSSTSKCLDKYFGEYNRQDIIAGTLPMHIGSNAVRGPLSIDFVCPLGFIARSEQHADHHQANNDVELHNTGDAVPSGNGIQTSCTPKSFEDMIGLGEWERHTKGIGGKLLMKMGYRRGCGLGRACQGITVPIEGLVKPLPTGLSLDFLHEVRSDSAAGPEQSLQHRVLAAVEATNKQRKIADTKSDVNIDDDDGVERSGLGGRGVTVFNFMNNMRTDEAQAVDQLNKQKEKEQARRKQEVQRRLAGKSTQIKSLF